MPSWVLGPVLNPPWIRHLPLAIAGDPQGVPLRRFLAPQRGAALAASKLFFHAGIKGLLSASITTPLVDTPGHNGLPTITYIDVLNSDNLLAARPKFVKGQGPFLKCVHHLC